MTQTTVARLSLAQAPAPATRTAHSIRVRARTVSGAGTIRAALYEGASNRSGDLESSALTTSLASYTLAISDVAAATIADYADLEIRVWGFAVGGGAIQFEIAEVSLNVPLPYPGATNTGIARISLAAADVPVTRTSHALVVRARKTSALHTGTLALHLFEGITQRTILELEQVLTSSLATYTLPILDADAATIGSYADLEVRIRGYSPTHDLTVFEVAQVSLSLPRGAGGAIAPNAPQNLIATAGAGQVVLGWNVPNSDGGSAITAYKIYRSTVSGGEALLASPAGTGTTYTDLTVVNDTTYYYKVSAVNAIGEGALSAEASATPTTAAQIVAVAERTLMRLYGPTLLGNTASTLYTCPALTTAVIRHIHVNNPSGADVDLTLSIGPDSAGARLWDGEPIPAGDFDDHIVEHILAEGEVIQAYASLAGTLNLTVDGYELSTVLVPVVPPPPDVLYPGAGIFPSDFPAYPDDLLLPH